MMSKKKRKIQQIAEPDNKQDEPEMQNSVQLMSGVKRQHYTNRNLPKRSMTASLWFFNAEKPKVEAEHPEHSFADVVKELNRRWAAADPETKLKYESIAEQDKERYDREMAAYKADPLALDKQQHEANTGEELVKKKKKSKKKQKRGHRMAEQDNKQFESEMQNCMQSKNIIMTDVKRRHYVDPNMPKRPLSASFWFCNDERPKLEAEHPERSLVDILREVSRRWAAADPETKLKYETLGAQDQERYDREMAAYKTDPLALDQKHEANTGEELVKVEVDE
ncbi:high mobility group protein DSP1 isoform X2 [Bicyclus anynana]|uniref:High mobility group protein DSP1 isoform X2 n=1 Tax=Bicyclus anynana TaxID=110368 RepID=A0ABM3LGA2_BICAN|nr:high mobility group protein DSP1 isoform X2 [Bicyclus anynana]